MEERNGMLHHYSHLRYWYFHFWVVGGSGDVSSILINSLWSWVGNKVYFKNYQLLHWTMCKSFTSDSLEFERQVQAFVQLASDSERRLPLPPSCADVWIHAFYSDFFSFPEPFICMVLDYTPRETFFSSLLFSMISVTSCCLCSPQTHKISFDSPHLLSLMLQLGYIWLILPHPETTTTFRPEPAATFVHLNVCFQTDQCTYTSYGVQTVSSWACGSTAPHTQRILVHTSQWMVFSTLI